MLIIVNVWLLAAKKCETHEFADKLWQEKVENVVSWYHMLFSYIFAHIKKL